MVERQNWQRVLGGYGRRPGSVRVATFQDAGSANRLALWHESQARAVINPFARMASGNGHDETPFAGRLRNPWNATRLSEEALVEALTSHGIRPPTLGTGSGRAWDVWWVESRPNWSLEQRTTVWNHLTKMRFYAVTEEPETPCVYAVLQLRWDYSRPSWGTTDMEGGTLVAVHRTRGRAEADALCRTQELVACPWQVTPFEMNERTFPDREFYAQPPLPSAHPQVAIYTDENYYHVGEVPLFEVHEVPCEPNVGDKACLVSRTAFTQPLGGRPDLVADGTFPVRLFPDEESARAWCAMREVEHRREFPVAWYSRCFEDMWGDDTARSDVNALLELCDLPPLPPPNPAADFLSIDFRYWWYEHGHRVTPDQCQLFWDHFHRDECFFSRQWVTIRATQ
ncbi:hypothetical protein [Limnoglobus roseus]|uniref:hypothetical protein n=1 Tax=Limnoglobus roseus TaxID=2598579 RepID=UPI0011EB83E9|nr:hypothetical protein [Limnoglobus roseus]